MLDLQDIADIKARLREAHEWPTCLIEEDIPALIAEVERLRAENEQLRAERDEARADLPLPPGY